MEIGIKTQIFDKIKFVLIDEKNLLDYDAYLEKALAEFGISISELGGVFMWDRDGTPITQANFATVVNQFKHSNCFLIKLGVSSNPNCSMLAQELKFYLLENGGKPFFDEETRNVLKNGQKNNEEAMERIAGKTLNELAKKMVSFINFKYTSPSRDEINNVCQSALELFTTIGGIEILFDAKKKKGIIWNKMTYQKYGKKDLIRALEDIDLSGTPDDISYCETLSEEEKKAAMLFFRTCIVENEKEALKTKLKQTIVAREVMIKKKGIKFFEAFPFYFVDPELILFDFQIRNTGINANALIEKWPKLKLDIPLELGLTDRTECNGYFNEEIGHFIALLKLLSQKPNFDEKVRAFLIFTDNLNDKPENIKGVHPSHPQLIAYGKERKAISHYCISLEKHMIHIPNSFSFVQVVDIFFKVHPVFHINYHPQIKNMMMFFDYFILNNKEGDATVNKKMNDLAAKLKLN